MKSDREICVGDVVISKAGRDKASVLAVVGLAGEGYVLLADGRKRKLAAPKLKKLKHIELVCNSETLAEALKDGTPSDKFVAEQLSKLERPL